MNAHRHSGLCGPDCPYRRLYEGSQASLADMASKQAGALNRVARLRGGIVSALKQTFAVEFGTAESQLGMRMSSADDEILLAYLDGFLAMPARRTAASVSEPTGLADLRDELAALGVDVPAGSDLASWAAAVATWSQNHTRPSTPPSPQPTVTAAAGPTSAGAAAAVSTAAAPPAVAVPAPTGSGPASKAAVKPPRRRTGGRGLTAAAPTAGFDVTSGFDEAPVSSGDEEIPWADFAKEPQPFPGEDGDQFWEPTYPGSTDAPASPGPVVPPAAPVESADSSDHQVQPGAAAAADSSSAVKLETSSEPAPVAELGSGSAGSAVQASVPSLVPSLALVAVADTSKLFDDDDFAEPAAAEPAGAGSDAVLSGQDLNDLFGSDDLTSLFDEDLVGNAEEFVAALFPDEDGDQGGAADSASAFPMPPLAAGLTSGGRPGRRLSLNAAMSSKGDTAPDSPAAPAAAPAPTADSAAVPGIAPSMAPALVPQLPAAPAAAQQASVTSSGAGAMSMRPELFPSAQLPKGGAKTGRRPTRTSRVSASPPDPRGLDVPIAEASSPDSSELTDAVFNQLVASVCIPRPVFISDLVAQVGSAEVVSAWEQRCRDLGTDSPVRFITPKPRHRARGSLVVPHSEDLRKAASEFTRSWWADCLDERRLRGAKLYEVAVLLHRFGDSIISNRIEGDVVVLRVNQARGLVGVAIALETDFGVGGTTRGQVADAVGELLNDRLTLVAVLTYSSGGGTLEKLAAAVREESEQRGWKPLTPVIASLSWDFAADGGSSALSVL